MNDMREELAVPSSVDDNNAGPCNSRGIGNAEGEADGAITSASKENQLPQQNEAREKEVEAREKEVEAMLRSCSFAEQDDGTSSPRTVTGFGRLRRTKTLQETPTPSGAPGTTATIPAGTHQQYSQYHYRRRPRRSKTMPTNVEESLEDNSKSSQTDIDPILLKIVQDRATTTNLEQPSPGDLQEEEEEEEEALAMMTPSCQNDEPKLPGAFPVQPSKQQSWEEEDDEEEKEELLEVTMCSRRGSLRHQSLHSSGSLHALQSLHSSHNGSFRHQSLHSSNHGSFRHQSMHSSHGSSFHMHSSHGSSFHNGSFHNGSGGWQSQSTTSFRSFESDDSCRSQEPELLPIAAEVVEDVDIEAEIERRVTEELQRSFTRRNSEVQQNDMTDYANENQETSSELIQDMFSATAAWRSPSRELDDGEGDTLDASVCSARTTGSEDVRRITSVLRRSGAGAGTSERDMQDLAKSIRAALKRGDSFKHCDSEGGRGSSKRSSSQPKKWKQLLCCFGIFKKKRRHS